MKQVYTMYVLCENQKEADMLKKICATYGACANFTCNQPIGKQFYNLYEVIALSEKELNLIKKEIDA